MSKVKPWELLQKALPDSHIDEFDFGMPLFYKGEDETSGRRYIEGVASTPDKDLQDEFVLQDGLDVKYFKKNGYFNNDHKPGFANKVGQPEDAIIKKVKDRYGKSVLGMWVKGYLWPKDSHQVADDIWELAQALEAAGADRKLGFSIQGKVLKRDGNKIIKSWIQDVAITPSPVNTSTWMDVVSSMTKSMWVTGDDIEEIRKGITVDLFKSESLIENTDLFKEKKGKALSSSAGLGVESLDDKVKLASILIDEKDEEVEKAIYLAYQLWKSRGYNESFSRSMACATIAKSLLI